MLGLAMPVKNIGCVFGVAKNIYVTICTIIPNSIEVIAVLQGGANGPELAEIIGTPAEAERKRELAIAGRMRVNDVETSAAGAGIGESTAVGVAGDVVRLDGDEDVRHVPFTSGALILGAMTGIAKGGGSRTPWVMELLPFDLGDDREATSSAVWRERGAGGKRAEVVPALLPDHATKENKSTRVSRRWRGKRS